MLINKRPRSLKRRKPKPRRSADEITTLKQAIFDIAQAENPMTIRHLFYRLVSHKVLPKTEEAYKATLVRLLGVMRENGEIPFEWFVDSTRLMRKNASYSSLDSLLDDCQKTYRRALWNEQSHYCEVWCEKDAIASILFEVTDEYDVPLMISRGFSSKTFLHSSGKFIKAQGKPTHIFYFGDRDPSGLSISRTIEKDLRRYSEGAELYFTRLAVTEEQIDELKLPTRPTKTSDNRANDFVGESVELDAISARNLKVLAQNAIVELIDKRAYLTSAKAEAVEREIIERLKESAKFLQTFQESLGEYDEDD